MVWLVGRYMVDYRCGADVGDLPLALKIDVVVATRFPMRAAAVEATRRWVHACPQMLILVGSRRVAGVIDGLPCSMASPACHAVSTVWRWAKVGMEQGLVRHSCSRRRAI